jgi:hypothetical protein
LAPSSGEKSKPSKKAAEAVDKLLIDHEDGGDMFLKNVRLSLNCTEDHILSFHLW